MQKNRETPYIELGKLPVTLPPQPVQLEIVRQFDINKNNVKEHSAWQIKAHTVNTGNKKVINNSFRY